MADKWYKAKPTGQIPSSTYLNIGTSYTNIMWLDFPSYDLKKNCPSYWYFITVTVCVYPHLRIVRYMNNPFDFEAL